MAGSLIFTPRGGAPATLPELGGKALNLWRMTRAGFQVPPWVALTTRAYRTFLKANGLDEAIPDQLTQLTLDPPQRLGPQVDKLQALMLTAKLPEEVAQSLLEAVGVAFSSDTFLAVRSSAVGEDTATASYAGQMDSFLFVRGADDLLEAVKKCWASAFTERILLYRHALGAPLFEQRMGVVIQAMIAGEVSGVTFTADPVSGHRDTVSISATYGVGEGIVAGLVATDTFTYDVVRDTLEQDIAPKTEQIVFDKAHGGGTTTVSVPKDRQERASLDRDQIADFATVWKNIEHFFGYPQDLEWTVAEGRLYILQSRPITTLSTWPGRTRVWDNSNIIESYAGVTTPLTYSFAREAYTIVYRQFCAIMGVSEVVIEENDDLFGDMLGLIQGRVYYNLHSWYRLLSLFPGYEANKGFMETMMGVQDVARFEPPKADPTFLQRWLIHIPRLFKLVARMGWNLVTIRRQIARFKSRFDQVYDQHRQINFDDLSADALVDTYQTMKRRLLYHWKPPLINDFFAMIFYGVLRTLTAKWVPEGGLSLQNDLLCGEGGVESTEPTKAIIKMALTIRADPELQAWLLATPNHRVYAELQNDSSRRELLQAVDDYIDRYGYRCMEELKLESLSFRDDPTFLFTLIKNFVTLEHLDMAAMEAREQSIRREAEQKTFKALGLKTTLLIVPRRLVFAWVLKYARFFVKNRENMRFSRTKIFGLVRDLMNAMGRKFARVGILADPRDIYYLEVNEIFDTIHGNLTTTNLSALVGLRKATFAEYGRDEPDEHFETYGPVWAGNHFKRPDLPTDDESEEGTLSGVGCCPGKVKAPVQVVRSANADVNLKGKILVAERTDPGWVPLFPAAEGLLIERGSLLSHSAIVARELGIPTIVGIRNLLNIVKSGQVVAMDGATGKVSLDGGSTG